MQAVVLVGGEGTRLRPLTFQTPKPMVPLFNVPFLERSLIRLREAGISHAILPAGYLPAAITDYFGDGERVGMRLTYVIEKEPLGTAGAIKNVAEHLTGPFFVLNGDILTSLNLSEMLLCHRRRRGIGLLHLITVEDPSAFGCVVTDVDARITSFIEKPPKGTATTNTINAGTYLLEPEVLDLIPDGRAVSIEREIFPILIQRHRLYGYSTSDYWIDLGRPEHYLDSHRHILEGQMNMPLEHRSVPCRLLQPSYIGHDVIVAPDATIGPYAVIGDHCRIGSGVHVRHSVLWDGVEIGSGASVDGAILASKVIVGAGATIAAGAVVGHGAEIPPDTRVAADARVAVL